MYARNDASKMEIHHNSRQESEMSGTSDFRLRTSDPFEVEYWVTGKEVGNTYQYKQIKEKFER